MILEQNFFITNAWYPVLGYIVIPIAIVALIVSIFAIKSKKIRIFLALILFLIIYEETLFILSALATQTKDINAKLKYMTIAASISVIPYEKGTIYSSIGEHYLMQKDFNKSVEYYEKSYKYLKKYNNEAFPLLSFAYTWSKDIDKAIKVSKKQKNYAMVSCLYVLKKDFESAKKYALMQIDNSPKNPSGYSQMALIYRNLHDEENAKIYYDKAKKLCKYKEQIKRTDDKYNNYETYTEELLLKAGYLNKDTK